MKKAAAAHCIPLAQNSFCRESLTRKVGMLVLIGLRLTVRAHAQTATGRIIGTVTDVQGAAIAGAKITITNIGTNARFGAVSNADGFYQVQELPIGTYTVTAERDGFAKVVTDRQSLDINQSLRIDMHMKIGALSETVTVEA